MAKLHVPPPDGVVDRSDVNLAMLFAVVGAALSIIVMNRFAEEHAAKTASEQPEQKTEAPRDIYDELADQRELAAKIGERKFEDLVKHEWKDAEIQAVMRFGPRMATEALCAQQSPTIRDDKASKTLRLELEKTLDRRTEFAPWTCMTRLYLAGEIPAGALANEMSSWWLEVTAHQGNARLVSSVVQDFRKARERPGNDRYYSWLRLCALNFDYGAHPECQKMLAQMAPEQGADLLGVIEKQWEARGAEINDMRRIIPALGHLARNGQPHSFKIDETDQLPDYDVDFRQAAVGYLCRMMNTPTAKEREGVTGPLDPVPELAGEHLRKVALVGARAYEEKLLMRWREACRIAFGGGANEDRTEMTPVPLLAVWDGDVAQQPDYRISRAIEWGTCSVEEGYPSWWCLADQWKDEERSLDAAMAHAFIKTRYMEWEDAWKPRPPDSPTGKNPPKPKREEPSPKPAKTEPKPTEPKPKPAEPKSEEKPESTAPPAAEETAETP